jgi:deoxyxylulose-5-phosphate synthase
VLIGFKIPFFQNLGLTFIFITNGRNIEQRIVAHVLNNLVIEP